jgi:hypothetical protein
MQTVTTIDSALYLAAAFTGDSFAADWPVRAISQAYYPGRLVPIEWTGVCFGVNAGYGWAKESSTIFFTARMQRTPTPRRPEISAPSNAVCAAASPDNDGDRPREWGDHKAEVDPRSISFGGPGKHEHMDHDPQADRESQSKPNEIARGLVYGRKAFALGAADAHRHGDECPDKQRSKHDSQYSQPHRDALCRRPAVGWTGLLWCGAQELNLAL